MAWLNSFDQDECCGVHLNAASLAGMLDSTDTFTCPDCGEEWRAEVYKLDMGEGVRHWRMHPLVTRI